MVPIPSDINIAGLCEQERGKRRCHSDACNTSQVQRPLKPRPANLHDIAGEHRETHASVKLCSEPRASS